MKAQTILAIAALGLSSMSMAGEFHGHFDPNTQAAISAQPQPSAQQQFQPSDNKPGQQDFFEQSNNWHVQHNAR